MTDVIRRLHTEIDSELDHLQTAADPADDDEPELAAYLTRLQSLRDAVLAAEGSTSEG